MSESLTKKECRLLVRSRNEPPVSLLIPSALLADRKEATHIKLPEYSTYFIIVLPKAFMNLELRMNR